MAYNPFRNFGLKALSVAIAAMFWFAVGGEQVVERSLRSPLELQNIPEGLEVTGDAPSTVDVRVRGASSAVGGLSSADVVTVIDTQAARPGRRLYHIGPSQVRVPFGVEVTYVGPATIALLFERQASKVVPVVPAIEGTPAPGHFIERVVADPAEVTVVGPESALRVLRQADTEPVKLDGAKATVRETVNLGLPDSSARLGAERMARVTVDIAPVRSERTLAAVPVRMRNLRGTLSARATPAMVAVTVRGADALLRELTADDIEASVDLAGLGPGRYTLSVRIASRYALAFPRVEPAQVQIVVR